MAMAKKRLTEDQPPKKKKKASVSAPQPAAEARQACAEVSSREKIALLAYSYWEARGRQGGSAEQDWYRAEQEVLQQHGCHVDR
jgi:hypothetical protein